MLWPMLAIVAIFWFVMIAPQRKEQKKRQAMLGELGKNDEVMTSSGIFGRVVNIQDDVVTLQVAEGVRMRFHRSAVQNVIGKDGKDAEPVAEPKG